MTTTPSRKPEKIPANKAANYRTRGLVGITEEYYYRGTLVESDNPYIKHPVTVEIKVWVFGVSGQWATFLVRTKGNLVWVTATSAIFENVTAIDKPTINP
jgi:hypothetical protein